MTLSMAVMPMSNFPSIRLVSWNTDEGVGVSSTSSPSRAKNPLSWAAQIGQLNPPGNTITWRVSSAAPGRGTPRRARARSRAVDVLIARTLPRRTLPRLTPGGTRSYDQRHIREEDAIAADDIQEACSELDRLGVSYWVSEGVVGPQSQEIFMHAPAGNMIELQGAGTCRCKGSDRADVSGMR